MISCASSKRISGNKKGQQESDGDRRKPAHRLSVGLMKKMNMPWKDALAGAEMPDFRLAIPPKVYSTKPSDSLEYEWKDKEVVLGIWLDGEIALCRYDEKEDRCLSVDGAVDFHAIGRGHPYWYIPLRMSGKLDDKET